MVIIHQPILLNTEIYIQINKEFVTVEILELFPLIVVWYQIKCLLLYILSQKILPLVFTIAFGPYLAPYMEKCWKFGYFWVL